MDVQAAINGLLDVENLEGRKSGDHGSSKASSLYGAVWVCICDGCLQNVFVTLISMLVPCLCVNIRHLRLAPRLLFTSPVPKGEDLDFHIKGKAPNKQKGS